MPTFNGFLVRDALSDTGVVPSSGYPYYSPDLICSPQVANPTAFFSANYTTDPNQPFQLGSQTNFIYVRAKNLAASTLSGWNMFVYRANASLFLNTSQWSNNPLSTITGNNFIPLPSSVSGAIAVGAGSTPGDGVFVMSGLSTNLFCLIGIASSTNPPAIPAPFTTYDAYITWVRSNQNVCGRNLTVQQDFVNRQYSRIDSFSNPSNNSVPVLFQISITGTLPAGSTFGVTCSPLNVNSTWNISQGAIQTASGMAPANFNGTVTTWGALPSGQTQWPSGVQISNNIYVGVTSDSSAAKFAVDLDSIRVRRSDVAFLGRSGRLVLLGSTATLFATSGSGLRNHEPFVLPARLGR